MLKLLCGAVLLFFSLSITAQRSWDTLPKLPDHFNARLAEFKKMPDAPGATIVLGNGLVEKGNWKTLLGDSSVVNFGIEGDITFGILTRLREVIVRKPSRVLLQAGADDLSKGIPEETVMENIFTIAYKLRKALPSATIIVQGILSVNPAVKTFPKGYHHNNSIFTINDQLRRYAPKIGYTYVDLYVGFIDVKGQLDAKYTTDGVHLSAAGYAHWAARLKEDKITD